MLGSNWKEPVLVKFRPIINQILEVSEVNQKIDIKMWFLHEWFDERLVWDPREYGNITVLHIPADKLWLPDVAIYNNADGDFIISEMVRAKVYFNGTITWRPPIISKTFCEIRVADFPFGELNKLTKFLVLNSQIRKIVR